MLSRPGRYGGKRYRDASVQCDCVATLAGPGQPGDPFRGLSVHYLGCEFTSDVVALGFGRSARIYEIEERVIRGRGLGVRCPRDGRAGAAYVDVVAGSDNVGRASHMLSYTWGSSVADIADSLGAWCQEHSLDAKRTYIWICCLCVNQHRVKEAELLGNRIRYETFAKEFGDRVQGIGNVLALMEPWNKPQYATRVWCIYELFVAVQHADKCKLEIIMPPRESLSFADALRSVGGLESFWGRLAAVRVEEAEATVEEDRENILRAIAEGPGFAYLNRAAVKRLQAWAVTAAEAKAKCCLEGGCADGDVATEISSAFCTTGRMMRFLGWSDRAVPFLKLAQDILVRDNMLETAGGARLMANIGALKHDAGDPHEALVDFEASRHIRIVTGTTNTMFHAMLMMNLGIAKHDIGDFEGALTEFASTRDVLHETGTFETHEGARVMLNIGAVKHNCGDSDGAVDEFEKARCMYEALGQIKTPGGARLLHNLGIAKIDRGDLDGALVDLEASRSAYIATGTLEILDGARLLQSIGFLSCLSGDFIKALADYETAWTIYEATGHSETISGARLLQSIACIQHQHGDLEVMRDRLIQAQFSVKARTPGTMGDHTERQRGTNADFVSACSGLELVMTDKQLLSQLLQPTEDRLSKDFAALRTSPRDARGSVPFRSGDASFPSLLTSFCCATNLPFCARSGGMDCDTCTAPEPRMGARPVT